MAKRTKYDVKSPGTRELVDEIVHGTFVKEGTLLAFATCFPGMTEPIRADEGHITALDATRDGGVYGGTSGHACHLFVGMFHGVTGAVLDLGTVPGADRCAALACGESNFAAAVNGSDGGRVVARRLQPLPFDLIQEWGFGRSPFDELGTVGDGEAMVHMAAAPERRMAVGTSTGHLFRVDLAAKKLETVAELAGRGHVAAAADDAFVGMDRGALWRYEPGSGKLERDALDLPEGAWGDAEVRWARDPNSGALYTADAEGKLFRLGPGGQWSDCLGQVPLAPVRCMAVTFDGRLFGFCGREMARFFALEAGGVRDLGCAASVFERRRYGYEFAAATVGRDGEIVFGEDDDLGHLWIYFPRITQPA